MEDKKDHQAECEDKVSEAMANRTLDAERQQGEGKEVKALENNKLAPEEILNLLKSQLTKLRDIKIIEIEKVFNELISFSFSEQLKGITDYEKVHIPSPYENDELFIQEGGESVISRFSEEYINNIKYDFMKLINPLISFDYVPPNDFDDILNHIMLLWIYYKILWKPYEKHEDYPDDLLFATTILDLSLCKLVGVANKMCGSMKFKWERESSRLKKSITKIKAKADWPKTIISEIYYRNPGGQLKPGMKINKVVNIIHGESKKNLKDPPSIDTIKRYLMADEKIMKDFKKDGRYWIMQT